MNELIELIHEVRKAGADLRVDPPDLVIKPADCISPGLKAKLRAHKAELVKLLFEASMGRVEAANVLLAISEDGILRIVRTEAEADRATADGFTMYTSRDAYIYVTLSEHERRMLHSFKKRFGGTIQWSA